LFWQKPGKSLWVLVVLVSMLVFAVGCGGSSQEPPATSSQEGTPTGDSQDEPYKVAFMTVGPIGDGGWNFAHHVGKLGAENNLPWIEATFVENIPENQDAERTMVQFAREGNKIVFACSFGYMDYVKKAAAQFPEVYFLNCAHFESGANYGNYYGRMYQPRYLSGIIAGKMTETNILGYVASHPIPEVIRGINAFALGAQSVNPDVEVRVVWTNSWYDPAAEKEAGRSLLESGADIIAENIDTAAPLQAAEEVGKYGIGNNIDMSQYAPKAVLTTPVFNWDKFYTMAIEKIKDGKFDEMKNYWGGLADGTVDLAPYGPMVPQDVIDLVEAKKQEIIDGKWDVFTGPIKDQSGTVRVPEGVQMTDEEMLQFDWFVEGVQGSAQ
jgi:basic membrane protein A